MENYVKLALKDAIFITICLIFCTIAGTIVGLKICNTDMKAENALVVVDCQNDFITGSLANKEAQKKIPNIVNKIRNFREGVIFVTLDTHTNRYMETMEGQKLPYIHCVKGTEGWELDPNVKAALNDADLRDGVTVYYIEKPTFGSYDLVEKIESRDYKNIEFVGFCTDICVVSNAIMVKASVFNSAEITVDASCCAGVTPEKHNAALDVMESCQINIINR